MKNVSKIYFDWNVFNKLEHINALSPEDSIIYSLIDDLTISGVLIAPYSNAHINDLFRGYVKDPSYTPGHLENIRRLTKNLCVVQYWGEMHVKWHYRNPNDFLNSKIEDDGVMPTSFGQLYSGIGEMAYAWELKKLLLQEKIVPDNFSKAYKTDPIFSMMFPRTKIHMNLLALCEDIYDFSYRVRHDFALYKHYRRYIGESKTKLPQYRKLLSEADVKVSDQPPYLSWDEFMENVTPKFSPSSNKRYDLIVGAFTSADIKGYRQDERFVNMIDDALHCFYSAHCDFFITLDSRCYDKAKLVFKKLNIDTMVFTPNEFVDWWNHNN